MKRVLLTGATGFIGRHAGAQLAAAGFEVHAVLPEERLEEWKRVGSEWDLSAVRLHIGDLLSPDDQRRLIAEVQPTHVLHLAWYVAHGKFWSAIENIDWVNASLTLMRTFGESGGKRWVGAGTCAEYDWRAGGECDETRTPLRPATLYGASKHAVAELQRYLAARLGVSFAWGRVFHLYGPGEPPQRLVPAVIRSLLAGEPAALTHGAQSRDFAHVEDVSAAFVSILGSDCEGAVNIGSGERTTVRNVAEIIGDVLNGKDLLKFGALDAGGQEPLELVPVVDRLRSTGFVPRWSLREGLADTVRWWRLRAG